MRSLLRTRFVNCIVINRFCSSALYVPGNKGSVTYSVLTPYINFNERLNNLSKLNDSISQRGLVNDTNNIIDLWKEYLYLKNIKTLLETNRKQISDKVNALKREKASKSKLDVNIENEIERLKLAGKLMRDDLKCLMTSIWGIEENVILRILKLPNDLDPKTNNIEVEIFSHLEPLENGIHHLKVASDLIEIYDSSTYFLKNKAAMFEQAALSYFYNSFMSNHFIPFSNPDFIRNIVLEGYGHRLKHLEPIVLDTKSNNKLFDSLNLFGGASIFPFLSYHSKHIVQKEDLPVKYIVKGKIYNRVDDNTLDGLYSVWQNSAVHMFIGTNGNVMEEFDRTLVLLKSFYQDLSLPFRMTYAPARILHQSEMLRVSFQVHSPYNNKYVEIGNLSLFGNFISQRLRMYYFEEENKFLNIISGTVVKVQPLLACLLEYGDKMKIPSKISFYMNNIQSL